MIEAEAIAVSSCHNQGQYGTILIIQTDPGFEFQIVAGIHFKAVVTDRECY